MNLKNIDLLFRMVSWTGTVHTPVEHVYLNMCTEICESPYMTHKFGVQCDTLK